MDTALEGVIEPSLATDTRVAPHQRALSATPTPADLLSMAVTQGADLDRLERLMNLQAQWEAKEARKAFVQAMTQFKAVPIEILKDTRVNYKNRDGSLTQYNHATLAGVVDAAVTGMAQFGLSHRWDTKQFDGGQIEVTCIITHEQGHSETTTLRSGADQSGGKNNIQAIASTISYLQRYTLLAATGLATKEMDDDGRSSDTASPLGGTSDSENPERDRIVRDLYAVADNGVAALLKAWQALPEKSRGLVGVAFGDIKKRAQQVGQ